MTFFIFFLNMSLRKRNDSLEQELFDSCSKDTFRELDAAIFRNLIKASDI